MGVQALLQADGLSIAIVVSRFNELVSRSLLTGARDGFERMGLVIPESRIIWTPGAFEIPVVVRQLLVKGGVDGVLCLGAVIRGETAHFDFIANEVTKGIAALSLEYGVPVSFGLLTTHTMDQAIDRSGGKMGNKGEASARALVETIRLLQRI